MSAANVPEDSRQFADRAVVESLIGMLSMDAETGNPGIFRVKYRTETGELVTSPYGLFAGRDESRLLMATGRPGEETLGIPKSAIVQITLAHPLELVEAMNASPPAFPISRVWTATWDYCQESYRQWERAVASVRRVSGVNWLPDQKSCTS